MRGGFMVIRTFKLVLYAFCIALTSMLCSTASADFTREQQIVEVNGIEIYKTAANRLTTVAKAKDIEVAVDAKQEVVKIKIADSRLSVEISDMFNRAMLKDINDDDIVLEKNKDKNSILKSMQVNKARKLIIGVEIFEIK